MLGMKKSNLRVSLLCFDERIYSSSHGDDSGEQSQHGGPMTAAATQMQYGNHVTGLMSGMVKSHRHDGTQCVSYANRVLLECRPAVQIDLMDMPGLVRTA